VRTAQHQADRRNLRKQKLLPNNEVCPVFPAGRIVGGFPHFLCPCNRVNFRDNKEQNQKGEFNA